MNANIHISAYTLISALGSGVEIHKQALINQQSGLTPCDFKDCDLTTFIGKIADIDKISIECNDLIEFNCRNNKIAYKGLMQDGFNHEIENAIKKYGNDRIGVVIGTSTSSFYEFEDAYKEAIDTNKLPEGFAFTTSADFFATPLFITKLFNLNGPSFAINTACSSSAKAFISAARMLQVGLCDAVIVGGVDSLCLNTLYGFASLELLSESKCMPCDRNRTGLNIGEAGAFILLERAAKKNKFNLLGYGESADAYHMSSPHPNGKGAVLAMTQALKKANINANQVDYINMHGTATIINDRVEDIAIYQVFKNNVPCSSTKGWTAHTLGAAGALEAVLSFIMMEIGLMPGCLNSSEIDSNFKSNIQLQNTQKDINIILSNSFGFGGNNCSLIFGKCS